MTTDTTALQERIERELEEMFDGGGFSARDMARDLAPIIAAEVQAAKAEALRESADWWAANPDDDVFKTDEDARNWLRDVATEYETGD